MQTLCKVDMSDVTTFRANDIKHACMYVVALQAVWVEPGIYIYMVQQ